MPIQFKDKTLTIFESALYRTISTLVNTKDFVLLVDPNWLLDEIQEIKVHVDQVRGNKPLYLLFTHSDYDHIIGYRAFEADKVIVSKAFQENPKKEDILQEIKNFDDQYYIKRNYPIEYPEGDLIVFKNGQTWNFGNTKLTFYLAPGHTADGLFTVIESLGIFIAGDYLSNIEFPFIYHSRKSYLETLEKVESILQNHQINFLIPGHGDFTNEKEEMKRRVRESKEYIEEVYLSIRSGKPFDEERLLGKYSFPGGLRKCHLENIELLSKGVM